MNTEEESKKGRRWFVTKFAGRTVLAGLGALTLGRLIGKDGSSAQAADGNPLIIGQANSGSSTTFLTSSPPAEGAAAFNVDSASTMGAGIRGISTALSGRTAGIQGFSNSPEGTGILGVAASTSLGARRPVQLVSLALHVASLRRQPNGDEFSLAHGRCTGEPDRSVRRPGSACHRGGYGSGSASVLGAAGG